MIANHITFEVELPASLRGVKVPNAHNPFKGPVVDNVKSGPVLKNHPKAASFRPPSIKPMPKSKPAISKEFMLKHMGKLQFRKD